jgi:hypothetical protein
MAGVPVWRHHLGSLTGPVGIGLQLLGVVGLWFCCRRTAPRLAAFLLVSLYVDSLFAVLQHGIYGPMGFALRYCGADSEAVVQITRLEGMLLPVMKYSYYAGVAIWVLLALSKKAGVPRWTVLFCPALVTGRVDSLVVYVPAPLGFPLYGGWGNIVDMIWFAVLALTYRDEQRESGERGTRVPVPPQRVAKSWYSAHSGSLRKIQS